MTTRNGAASAKGMPAKMAAPAVGGKAEQVAASKKTGAQIRSKRKKGKGKTGRGDDLIRVDTAPIDDLDLFDRHETRATASKKRAKRYAARSKDRRKNDWHHVGMASVASVVAIAVYVAGIVALSRAVPNLSAEQAAKIIGYAYLGLGGSALGTVAVRSVARAMRRHYRRRSGGNP